MHYKLKPSRSALLCWGSSELFSVTFGVCQVLWRIEATTHTHTHTQVSLFWELADRLCSLLSPFLPALLFTMLLRMVSSSLLMGVLL